MLNTQHSSRRFTTAVVSGLALSILIVVGALVEAAAHVQSFI